MHHGNLYDASDVPASGERFDTLLRHRNLVVERIVSSADMVPSEYVQAQDEWVLLVHGSAVLDIDGRETALKAGDYVFLPAGTPHTVLSVSEGTMWLALHLHQDTVAE